MRPDLRLVGGRGSEPSRPRAPRQTRTAAEDRLTVASERLRRLEQLLRHSGRPAEALAARHVRDLVLEAAGDVAQLGIA